MNDMMKYMLLMQGMNVGTSALQSLFAKLNQPKPQPIQPQQIQLVPDDQMQPWTNGMRIPRGYR